MAKRGSLSERVQRNWYAPGKADSWLKPLSKTFATAAGLRKKSFDLGLAKATRLTVPVIVVGNIAVGGTGKTPLVIAIVTWLQQHGYKPGVISRGYGGESDHYPMEVSADSDAAVVGDEPLLIAQRCGCPVAVAPERPKAGELLIQHHGVDVLVTDDGLQHYALARDIEVVVVDAERGIGNGQLLPAGPLREPAERLLDVDLVVSNGGPWSWQGQAPATTVDAYPMLLESQPPQSLTGTQSAWADWQGRIVKAIAGIGNPSRFFAALEQYGLQVEGVGYADHHHYEANDPVFDGHQPLLMTEKDAVKCCALDIPKQDCWFVPVTAALGPEFYNRLQQRLNEAVERRH